MNRSILVLPGGGYRKHTTHEREPIAEWLRTLGWDARVIYYPLLTRHPEPLRVVQREIEIERETHETVGVIGYSAGGHLAGLAALTGDSTANQRPDFALLSYPLTSMLRPTHKQAQTILLGERASWRARRAISLHKLVTPASPPMFVWHTAADEIVSVKHAYLLGAALAQHGVPHDLHIFEEGRHGIGFADGLPAAAWSGLAETWLAGR